MVPTRGMSQTRSMDFIFTKFADIALLPVTLPAALALVLLALLVLTGAAARFLTRIEDALTKPPPSVKTPAE